jgi:iron(III) transport system permease protein
MNIKIIKFVIITALFSTLIFWVFNNVKSDFIKISQDRFLKSSQIVASSIPKKPEELKKWFSHMKEIYPDMDVLYVHGNSSFGEKISYYYQSENVQKEFEEIKKSSFYKYGIENSEYDQSYLYDKILEINGKKVFLVFEPVDSPDGYVMGTLILTYDANSVISFSRMIDLFALAIISIFIVVYLILKFTMDPVLGFTILTVFGIVGTFIVYPLYESFKLTFIKNGAFSFEIWKSILSTSNYTGALWGSLQLGILTATVSTFIAFIFAFSITRMQLRGKKFFTTMATMPVISPPFSLTLSIILLFGNNGLITKQLLGISHFSIYGLLGLVLVQTMGMFPIAFMVLSGVLQSIDSTFEEAAMNLKANRWKVFRTITLPLSFPGIASAWLLVFSASIADFANPLLLAGKYRVLSVTAYIEVTGMHRLQNGAALSLLLLIPTLVAFSIQRYLVSRKSYVTVTGKPSARIVEIANKPTKALLIGFMVFVSAFLLGLYGTIFAGCFVKNWGIDYSFTLSNIVEALQRGRDTIIETTTLSSIAAPVAAILAMITAMIVVRKKFVGKKILQMLVMTPFAIPGTLVGISYIIAFNKPPLLLVGTAAIIIINYIIRELPVGLESGISTLRQIDPSIEEAAQSLGANTQTVFRTITLPLLRPAFISSMSYTFVRSMTAVSAVIFLISARWYHITVLIYNFSENLRFGLASVLASTLIIIILLVFALIRIVVPKSKYLEKNVITR